MNKSRTHYTRVNAQCSFINRIAAFVCSFASRSVFVSVLSREYLGLGGMFGNIFGVLSLCELGVGEAVSQALYKPLADGNGAETASLVAFLSRIYRIVAIVSFTAAMAFMPFLPTCFSDIVHIPHYRLIYLLFALHQSLSYLFAPRRMLIVCDQRAYVVMNIRTASLFAMTLAQIAALVCFRSYIAYILLRVGFSVMEGAALHRYAGKHYPYLTRNAQKPKPHLKEKIRHNTGALFVHRIGAVINNSTDSILISSQLGLAQMGVFSNYSLIVGSLGSFIALTVRACSASVGNVGATSSVEKGIGVLKRLLFLNFVLVTNAGALLLALIRPILRLWLGDAMCFGETETVIMLLCFYLSYIRDPIQIYLETYGVFSETKYVYLARGILNLVLSLIFVRKFGMAGVFAGTFLSTLLVAFPAEPYLLFRYGFSSKANGFYLRYAFLVLSGAATAMLSAGAVRFLPDGSVLCLLQKGAACLLCVNLLIFLVWGRSEEFRSFFPRHDIKKVPTV